MIMDNELNSQLFREFINEEEAKKWAKENYGQWLNDIQITKYSDTSKYNFFVKKKYFSFKYMKKVYKCHLVRQD